MGCGASIKIGEEISKELFVFGCTIGQGGFAKVSSAMFRCDKAWYAVKEVNLHEQMKHPSGIQMLNNEWRTMEMVGEHPYIVKLHAAFHDNVNCIFVLDLHVGADLRYYLKKKNVMFTEENAAFVVSCISCALHHIHSKGIIHRDIKCENIIFDEHGIPYLTDFGVAHLHQPVGDCYLDLASDQVVCTSTSGTKQYLAPEIFTKSHRHSFESDFWSLGIVMYEMLFCRRPFENHCPVEFVRYLDENYSQHLARSPPTSSSSARLDNAPSQSSSASALSSDKGFFSSKTTYEGASPSPHPCSGSSPFASLSVPFGESANSCVKYKAVQPPSPTFSTGECSVVFSDSVSVNDCQSALPNKLRVRIPRRGRSFVTSEACVEVLEGLLDVRPDMRFGAGANYEYLKCHSWFMEQNVLWESVEERRLPSNVKIYSKEVQSDIVEKFLLSDEEESVKETRPAAFTTDQCTELRKLSYVSPAFRKYVSAPAAIPEVNERVDKNTNSPRIACVQ